MSHTHAGTEDRQAADEAKIQEHMNHFEHVLDVRLGDWWEARLSVQDILARANARAVPADQVDEEDDSLSRDMGTKNV